VELEELRRAITVTDPAAILVSSRILRRVLQAEFKVPYLLMEVPHERCYFFERSVLFRHVEQEELDIEPERLLPPTVILLARPTVEQMQLLGRDETLLKYWRLLFHAQVHLALLRRQADGHLTDSEIRSRIERIGRSEFEEIRTVLRHEHHLLTPGDDRSVFFEFAAVYLELRHFRGNLRATYFPALNDFRLIDQMLASDLDAEAIFSQTRLPGAPNPVVRTDTSSDESHDYYWKLLRLANRAGQEGDAVRAAILRTKAVRVAPAALSQQTRAEALKDLERLTMQLQEALKFPVEQIPEWLQVLSELLDKADQGSWPVEAKLLHDLQNVCVEHQRKLYALDLIEWALSAGKRPIKRPLPSLQLVRTTGHVRRAAQRLTMARVSDEDRQRLARLLQASVSQNEERLRERFRPILHDAFHDVGLEASNPPEQVALEKVVEELLDRISEAGFFSFSDLRDTLSRNQLKLPDLPDPYAYWRGDPLLRLDRRLASLLEGVYRRGELYLRWLESFSSLFFGTGLGRAITRNLVLPFGGAFVLVKGSQKSLHDYFGVKTDDMPSYTFALVGIFLLALVHVSRLRNFFAEAGRISGRTLRVVFYEWPVGLWRLPWLRAFRSSWPVLLVFWYAVKPLIFWLVFYLYWPALFGRWEVGILTFLLANVLLNSRFGHAINEAFEEALMLLYGWLRFELVQGLIRWIARTFKQITAMVENVLFSVSELLRSRSDENRLTQAARAVLGVVWFPIGYLARLYFVMLIEPTINPLKLPFSSIAYKILFLVPGYVEAVKAVLEPQSHVDRIAPFTGSAPAWALTVGVIIPTLWLTLWLLPGAFVFFFWELSENWRLFLANRSRRLRPVMVGRHGETVRQLLRPGFHSGTVPKLFAQLRNAEREAYRSGDWRPARTYRQGLHEVARSVQVFVERELVVLLRQSKSWPEPKVRVTQVVPSCNRLSVELSHADYPDEPVHLTFEARARWLLAGFRDPGWLEHLEPEPRQVVTSALAGLYKLAGVNLVREQLDSLLNETVAGYEVTDRQLVVWKEQRNGVEATYPLDDKIDELPPLGADGKVVARLPRLEAQRVFYPLVSLTWDQWVEWWSKDHRGEEHLPLFDESHQWKLIELPVAARSLPSTSNNGEAGANSHRETSVAPAVDLPVSPGMESAP
jgi:hypothetical protein